MAIVKPPEFQMRCTIWLEHFLWSRWSPEAGCLAFHRWLPNGEQDAITLPIQWRGELKVWFERFGFVEESGFVHYDLNRREITDSALERQAVVFSGPLFGRLVLQQVDGKDLDQVRRGTDLYEEHNRVENAPRETDYYVDFGKMVAKIIGFPIACFFDFIRYNYGQYWVRDFRPWDSRFQNLGTFFSSMGAEWFDEKSGTWRRFRPTLPVHSTVVSQMPWDQFLTEKDWRELSVVLKGDLKSDVAVRILSRANRFLDEEEVATSLVESITALEIGSERFLARRLARSETPQIAKLDEYWVDSKLKIVLAILDPPVKPMDASRALEAVKQRNAFVHEGRLPPESAKANVRSVLGIVARLLEPPGPKLPVWALSSRMLYGTKAN